jgi:NitT/TauT family transport system substrate-binding protein
MKKLLTILMALAMMLAVFTGCSAPSNEAASPSPTQAATEAPAETATEAPTPEPTDAAAYGEDNPLTVATLAGPTGMGMIQLFDNPAYEVSLLTSPDQISPKVISGEVSVATIPSNLAAVLYNKMKGGIKIVSVNTMGVLYIVENGDTVNSIEDLAGKTLYATGQGATPEYVLNKMLKENGLEDVTVEYKGAHADLANAVAAGDISLALLPEPFVSSVLAQNPDVTVKLDINEEWRKIFGEDAGMPMGVTIVSDALASDTASMNQLVADYTASVDYVLADTDSAAADIVAKQIVGAEAVAKAAIPRSGISFITGEDCIAILDDYFQVMFESNPQSLGGAIPDQDIYYLP